MTQDTRAALEAEVSRTGRSLSQTAEIWLDEARRGRAAIEQIAGGHELVPVMETLGELATIVRDHDLEPDFQHAALLAAWKEALPFIVPYVRSAIALQIEEETEKFKKACVIVLDKIGAAGDTDPAYQAALQPVHLPRRKFRGLVERRITIADIVDLCSLTGDWAEAAITFKMLESKDSAARIEIEAAKASIARLNELTTSKRVGLEDAEAMGIETTRKYLGIPCVV